MQSMEMHAHLTETELEILLFLLFAEDFTITPGSVGLKVNVLALSPMQMCGTRSIQQEHVLEKRVISSTSLALLVSEMFCLLPCLRIQKCW